MSHHQPTAREARAAVSRRIRNELCARGWSNDNLAVRIGREPSTVTNLISGANPSPAARLHLELAIGVAFWSSPDTLAACQAVAAFYGGKHPRTLNLRGLDALARKHLRPAGVRGRIRPREQLVAQLEAHAANK